MSTHNIGFYEDLTKIIFQLSSNFIKYAPYLFFWCIVEAQTYSSKNSASLRYVYSGRFCKTLDESNEILYLKVKIKVILPRLYEPRYEKTGFLHMRKQRRRSASRLLRS